MTRKAMQATTRRQARFVVLLAAVATMALVGPIQSGTASHANMQCDYESGWYGGPSYPDQVYAPPGQYINWTVWNSNLAYTARRHSGANLNIITYEQYWPSGLHSTNTVDGYDRYLISSMTRGGYTAASYEIVEYSHNNCA